MNQIWIVLRREYLERVKTKGFIIATIAMPVLMVGLIGLSAFMAAQGEQASRRYALLDLTGVLAEEVAEGLNRSGYDVEVVPRDTPPDELDQRLLDDELQAVLIVDDLTMSEGVVIYRGKDGPGLMRRAVIRSEVVEAALARHLAGAENAGAMRTLMDGGRVEFESVLEEEGGQVARIQGIAVGLAGAFLLYMTMLLYGAYVLRAVLDEKRNRVVEVVISSVTPWRLMLGKVLGVGLMGLTQLGIWAASALLLVLAGVPMVIAAFDLPQLQQVLQFLPPPSAYALLAAYFILGYFLFASLFAAVGAMCSTEEEAQQAQFPVIMLLIIPLIMQMTSLEGARFPWMDWVALFPFFSPVMMFPRAVAGAVPWWMTGLSLVFMAAALVGTAWLAGRIYRVGILMQGKRPNLRELLRWVRSA